MEQLHIDCATLAAELSAAGGIGQDRDLALYRLAVELTQNLPAFAPGRYPDRPSDLNGMTAAQIREACEKSATLALLFGRFRADVTELEMHDARSLTVLARTTDTLLGLRTRTRDARTIERIERMLGDIATFLSTIWKIDLPLDCDVRHWAIVSSRNYELLPRAWRHL